MNSQPTRRRLLQIAGTGTLAGLAGCSRSGTSGSGESRSATMRLRIENVAPTDYYPADASTGGGIWLTPGVYAVHTSGYPIVSDGEAASVGLEALAEAGRPTGFEGQSGLVDEVRDVGSVTAAESYTANATVADPNDPTGEVPGAPPIAPGGAFEVTFEIEPVRWLSIASMVVPSNDVFIAPAQWIQIWPADAAPIDTEITDKLALWDAGTEPNGRPGFGPDQPPTQNASDQGADEDGVVRQLSAVDDGHDYPAVEELVQVTIAPV